MANPLECVFQAVWAAVLEARAGDGWVSASELDTERVDDVVEDRVAALDTLWLVQVVNWPSVVSLAWLVRVGLPRFWLLLGWQLGLRLGRG